MGLSHKIEYYNVCNTYVAAVTVKPDRVIQTWVADAERGAMVRDPMYIGAVESDSRVRKVSKVAFQHHCSQHNIETTIPKSAIEQTLALISSAPSTKNLGEAISHRLGLGKLAIG